MTDSLRGRRRIIAVKGFAVAECPRCGVKVRLVMGQKQGKEVALAYDYNRSTQHQTTCAKRPSVALPPRVAT